MKLVTGNSYKPTGPPLAFIRLETKSCRISCRKLTVKYDWT